ncbi:MAG: argininosuccinate synthase [Candidatus Omnitrophica bacterium]|nr:argininosuccinate synthase [Candidatus Omnitrophota bacterium]
MRSDPAATGNKVVLAYSGGLDTSVIIRWLMNRGYRVIAVCADVGQGEDLRVVRERALACGASKVFVLDLRKEFAREYVLPALKAGAVYEGKYLLATALSRPLIAKAMAQVARAEKARTLAHGCTGKGNDQVRIEVSLRILSPGFHIIAPVREWELKSRDEEIRYAQDHHLPIAKKSESKYSIDQNLWGVSIESGPLENPWTEPPEEAFRWTKNPATAPAKGEYVTIDFLHGTPAALNGRKLPLVELIQKLNAAGSRHGVGRTDMVEDRLVGIKSREVYEAPAATILHAAHSELERLTLDRETLAFKEAVAQRYSRLIYDGLWFSPLKAALDKFVEETQVRVTGTVRIKLLKGQAICVGRKSPYSRYAEKLATYGAGDQFDQSHAAGFITLWGLPYAARRNGKGR